MMAQLIKLYFRGKANTSDATIKRAYAKLDVERLRVYALTVPEATGYFAKFPSGGRENS